MITRKWECWERGMEAESVRSDDTLNFRYWQAQQTSVMTGNMP